MMQMSSLLVPKSWSALIRAVKLAKLDPGASFSVPGDWPLSSRDVMQLWERGVHARASRGLPILSARQLRRYDDLKIDALRINEYRRGIRSSGCRGLLRDQRMKRKYPHIDNQSCSLDWH